MIGALFSAPGGSTIRGEEVKTARRFQWENIAPALPKEIGRVPLREVCTLGALHYVDNFDLFIRDPLDGSVPKAPKVMVHDADWPRVCRGLIESGVCTVLSRDDVYSVGGVPLLNGPFGVTKDEWENGFETYRLIMNMIPLNLLARPLQGDIDTLPSWALMTPYFIQPGESLLISSEDIRCFFYTMSVPATWYKFLAFNKPVPTCCLPEELNGQEAYLAARVLPMGFLNSVSLAQHVHRNLTLWSASGQALGEGVNRPEQELRKDKPLSVCRDNWRVYLDNYDLLERVESTGLATLSGSLAPAVLSLRQEYERWEMPRNVKKSVMRSLGAEVQGAYVDGELGLAFPREGRLLKYIAAAFTLLGALTVSQRELQVVCGGLVYFSMFRRQLLGCLNAVWRFIESFNELPGSRKALPLDCKIEILRFVALIPLARLNFRLPVSEQVTCSDASTVGGGVCASQGVTRVGVMVEQGQLRGEAPELRVDHKVLTIGLFDGIAALRVAADVVGLDMVGHISVEKDGSARRVVESQFPETLHIDDVCLVDDEMVQQWSLRYSQAALVVVGAGPPCQGVSGLNADRKGALRDERSSLFSHVRRISGLVARHFVWAQVHVLMESVKSMDTQDRDIMSEDFGSQPWECDAGSMTWCSRPRLYWITWELQVQDGVTLELGSGTSPGRIELYALQDLDAVCKEGWTKVDPSRPFPTFTTSRPRPTPGRKPAGVAQCTPEELDRWLADLHRFPPYQYCDRNCMIDTKDTIRVPDVEEREVMLGFPVGYTSWCLPKADRKTAMYNDTRLTLLGNSWSVPVVAWLLCQLCAPLGLCSGLTPQGIMDRTAPGGQGLLQARLWRLPLRPWRGTGEQSSAHLVEKLANLVSIKGEDLLLTAPSSQMIRYHRLRATVPAKLWRWSVVTGWTWTGAKEHINCLELRAILTALKWRIGHKGMRNQRFLHLTDSLVSLHALSRGRSSSRKLRSTLSRINALLLLSSSQGIWGYIHTDSNPADRPSRWGRRVKTKFRHA